MCTPVARHVRPWGVELELADGSLWRETPSGSHLVRLPTAYNTAALRSTLRERWPTAAAAWATPPATAHRRPAAPPPTEERFTCARCGGDLFAADAGDPTTCVRCAAAARRLAQQGASPWRCQQCGRGRDLVTPAPDGKICVPCVRRAAAAAD